MPGRNYRDLVVWQRAMDLLEATYSATSGFPREELFGLTGQMRRAAVSIPANIAEGQGRGTDKEIVHYSRIGYGSLRELETHVLIAVRLKFLDEADGQGLLDHAAQVGRLLNGLMKSFARE